MEDDAVAVVRLVTEALNAIGIPYAIGGSFASSAHGFPRTTNDADVIAAVRADHVGAIQEALGHEFYVDAGAMLEAVQRGGSFNLIHYESAFKVDVFVSGADRFRAAQIARGTAHPEMGHDMRLISPEDTVLAKLLWYREGGEVSERQWRDVLEVIKAQGERLDAAYLERTAEGLGLSELLAKAFAGA